MKKAFFIGVILIFFSSKFCHAQYILSQSWKAKYNGGDTLNDLPIAIDDVGGYIYVGGTATSTPYPTNLPQILKYDPSTGKNIWAKTYYYPSYISFISSGISLDRSSNVYIVGTKTDYSIGKSSIAILKYDKHGNFIWEQDYLSPSYLAETAYGIKVDVTGSIYVMGTVLVNSNNAFEQIQDLILLKYNGSGKLLWSTNYNNSSGETSSFYHMSLDTRTHSVYVTGTNTLSNSPSQAVTAKYDSLGHLKWSTMYQSPLKEISFPGAMCLDPNGNVYVASVSDQSMATYKINPANGKISWIQRYTAGSKSSGTVPTSIICDNYYVYVTSYSDAGNESLGILNYDMATIKYGQDGSFKWVNRFDSGLNDFPSDITFDNTGYIYVSGIEQSTKPNYAGIGEMVLLLLNPQGKQVYKYNYDGGNANGLEASASIAIDNKGAVYQSGSIYKNLSSYDVIVSKYTKVNPFGNGGGGGGGGGDPGGIKGVLNLSSQDVFNFIIDSLNRTPDTDPIVAQLQQKNNYVSLQTKIENKEDSILNAGGDIDSTNDPENYFIVDDDLQALLNSQNEIIIGNTLYKFLNDSTVVTITNPTQAVLTRVRNNDPTVYRLANVSVVNTTSGIFNATIATCTDFIFSDNGANSVLFTTNGYGNSTSGVNYLWDFGDGTTQSVDDPNTNFPHTYAAPGKYDVCLTITGGTCDGTHVCHTVNVGTGDCNPAFTISSISGNNVTVINQSYGNYTSVKWDFGDGDTSNLINPPTHVYPDSGTYTISLQLLGGGCDSIVYSTTIILHGVAPGTCNCDRRDREKFLYINYVNGRKFKAKGWFANYGIIQYYRVGAKIKNYKKVGRHWSKTSAQIIEATIFGSFNADEKEPNGANYKCVAENNLDNPDDDTEFNKKKAKIVVQIGERFGVSINAIHYIYGVRYNGNNYKHDFYLSDTSKIKPCGQ